MIFKKISNMENVEAICHYFYNPSLLMYPSYSDFTDLKREIDPPKNSFNKLKRSFCVFAI